MLVISAESHHHLGPLQPFNMGKNDKDMSNLQQIGQTLTTHKAGCQIPLRGSQKRCVAANLQPLPTCQIYTCFIESGPPHLKCTTLILPALPLTSFAWKPPHAVAGINSSNLGGHSNASVRTKLAPLAPGLHENLHRLAPAGHLLAVTIYCQKCQGLHAGLQLIYGLSPHFCKSVLNGLYGNGMTGVTKNSPAQTSR